MIFGVLPQHLPFVRPLRQCHPHNIRAFVVRRLLRLLLFHRRMCHRFVRHLLQLQRLLLLRQIGLRSKATSTTLKKTSPRRFRKLSQWRRIHRAQSLPRADQRSSNALCHPHSRQFNPIHRRRLAVAPQSAPRWIIGLILITRHRYPSRNAVSTKRQFSLFAVIKKWHEIATLLVTRPRVAVSLKPTTTVI